MAFKSKASTKAAKNEAQFIRTAENLRRKGKTNKKLKSNPNAKKYN